MCLLNTTALSSYSPIGYMIKSKGLYNICRNKEPTVVASDSESDDACVILFIAYFGVKSLAESTFVVLAAI